MTSLQLAIDTLTPSEAVALVEKVHPYIDLIEAGTPFIKRFGLDALKLFRQVAPGKLIVADMKAMDAGAYEAAIAFEAGADIMTVLGCANDETILGALQEANKCNRLIAVDLIAVQVWISKCSVQHLFLTSNRFDLPSTLLLSWRGESI